MITGQEKNTVKINAMGGMFQFTGAISDDGTKIYSFGMWNDVEILTWRNDEELEVIKEDREHIDNLTIPYKIQPENQGKLVWLSGNTRYFLSRDKEKFLSKSIVLQDRGHNFSLVQGIFDIFILNQNQKCQN